MTYSYEIDYGLDPVMKSKLLDQAYNTKFKNMFEVDPNNSKSQGEYNDIEIASCGSFTSREITITPLIEQMMNLINPNLVVEGCMYLHLRPNQWFPPHVDESLIRESIIAWTLSPDIENFAPAMFHDENDKIEKVFYYSDKPSILNTRYRHSVKNNSYDRYSFQLLFRYPIEELIEFDQKYGIIKESFDV